MKFNSEKIKSVLDEKKLSITWLAQQLELDRNLLAGWFRRGSMPDKHIETYKRLCNLIGFEDSALPATIAPVDSIPYFDIDVSASDLTFIDGAMRNEPAEFYQIPGLQADFIVPVFGESMTDVICPGDKIAVKRIKDMDLIPYGQKFLVVTEEHRMVKYVKRHLKDDWLMLVSENPHFDRIEVPRRKILALYKVVEVLKREEI